MCVCVCLCVFVFMCLCVCADDAVKSKGAPRRGFARDAVHVRARNQILHMTWHGSLTYFRAQLIGGPKRQVILEQQIAFRQQRVQRVMPTVQVVDKKSYV